MCENCYHEKCALSDEGYNLYSRKNHVSYYIAIGVLISLIQEEKEEIWKNASLEEFLSSFGVDNNIEGVSSQGRIKGGAERPMNREPPGPPPLRFQNNFSIALKGKKT